VFFSAPLDLDFMMLRAFPAAYQASAPGEPRIPDAASADRVERLREAVRSVLKERGGDAKTYSEQEQEAFYWYRYLFLGRAKPTTHFLALSSIDKAALSKDVPAVLRRLVRRLRRKLSTNGLGDA
jgi:hypothetical protein